MTIRSLSASYRPEKVRPNLKSLDLPHHLICQICRISKPTLGRYLPAFEQAGVAGLKPLDYKGRPNALQPHAASLASHFRQHPPHPCAQAQTVIAAQTGVVPGPADTPEKQAEQGAFLKKSSTLNWPQRKRTNAWCCS